MYRHLKETRSPIVFNQCGVASDSEVTLVESNQANKDLLISKKGQATKGSRWIPRHTEAKKDAVTSDILWGAGSRH